MRTLIWTAVILVVVVGISWFAFKKPVQAPSRETGAVEAPASTSSEESTATPSIEIGGSGSVQVEVTKIFNITGSNFKFDPTEIRVKKGDTVRIVFKNSGGMHDWRLDEFGAATKVLQGGQSETIEFVASRAGTFEYYCSVGEHRQMGMVGKLIVSQ